MASQPTTRPPLAVIKERQYAYTINNHPCSPPTRHLEYQDVNSQAYISAPMCDHTHSVFEEKRCVTVYMYITTYTINLHGESACDNIIGPMQSYQTIIPPNASSLDHNSPFYDLSPLFGLVPVYRLPMRLVRHEKLSLLAHVCECEYDRYNQHPSSQTSLAPVSV